MSVLANSAAEAVAALAEKQFEEGYEFKTLHPYKDSAGNIIYWRIRLKHPDGRKWIRPLSIDDNGYYNLVEPTQFKTGYKPIYNLDLVATNPEARLWIVEGESCADELNSFFLDSGLGYANIAITSGAATSAESTDWSIISGREVIIFPDNDEGGLAYAQIVGSKLESRNNVSIVDILGLNLPEKGDVVDWLQLNQEASLGDLRSLPKNPVKPASGISYRRFSDIKPRAIEWLWQGNIGKGKISILAGHPGLGKSQITAFMAAVVTQGGKWPANSGEATKGAVAFLSAEDDAEDTIHPRLQAAGADVSQVYILDAVVEVTEGKELTRSFNLAEDVNRLEELLQRHPEISLVIIDPITAYLGQIDSHKTSDVRAVLKALADFAAAYGVAIVCISHLNKAKGTDTVTRITGSMAFVAAARAVFLIEEDGDNKERRYFLPVKNNLGNDRSGLAFSIKEVLLPSDIRSSAVVWEDAWILQSASEILANRDNDKVGKSSALNEAKLFLRNLLADGPRNQPDILKEAKEALISIATLKRAKQELGVASRKSGWMVDGFGNCL